MLNIQTPPSFGSARRAESSNFPRYLTKERLNRASIVSVNPNRAGASHSLPGGLLFPFLGTLPDQFSYMAKGSSYSKLTPWEGHLRKKLEFERWSINFLVQKKFIPEGWKRH